MRVTGVVQIVRYKENTLMKEKNLWINIDFISFKNDVFDVILSMKSESSLLTVKEPKKQLSILLA